MPILEREVYILSIFTVGPHIVKEPPREMRGLVFYWITVDGHLWSLKGFHKTQGRSDVGEEKGTPPHDDSPLKSEEYWAE